MEPHGDGAGDGNRTHVSSLGSCSSTIELHPRGVWILVLLQTALPLRQRGRERLLLPSPGPGSDEVGEGDMAAVGTRSRSKEQVLEHYQVEKELAQKLRHASREQRRGLYTEVYDELLKRVRHHPLLAARRTAEDVKRTVDEQLARLEPYIGP